MIWIAPSEKDTENAALEKRLWDGAEQAAPAAHFAETDFNSGRPEGLLGLNFLRFGEVCFAQQTDATYEQSNAFQRQIQNLHGRATCCCRVCCRETCHYES